MSSLFVAIFFGRPGAGKGTQARRIAEKFNLVNFDTGRFIEEVVHNPLNQDDPVVQKERKNFDQGYLCAPEWVVQIVREKIKKIYQNKQGLVFSGSPRTLYEAEKIMPLLSDLYGQENIFVFKINLSQESAVSRNLHRRICEKCGYQVIYSPETKNWKFCPLCGGKLVVRSLDNEKSIKVRWDEYRKRTQPVLDYLAQNNFQIFEINGEPAPDIVTGEVLKYLKSLTK